MKISIAIPDSALKDESTLLGKSQKISIIARACAIFQVDEIYIYHESQGDKGDSILLVTILKYLETPQYLRKQLFPKTGLLKYAGVLHPLKIPSHKTKNPTQIKAGDTREGIIVSVKGEKFLDLGLKNLFRYFGNQKPGKRVTIQFKKGFPQLFQKEISKDEISEYWGYRVKERSSLPSLLSSWNGNIILTSRKGKIITKTQSKWYSESNKPTLIVFGSPQRGVHEILGDRIKNIQNSKLLNFFPKQATETVRLEEALLGTLSILNLIRAGYL